MNILVDKIYFKKENSLLKNYFLFNLADMSVKQELLDNFSFNYLMKNTSDETSFRKYLVNLDSQGLNYLY